MLKGTIQHRYEILGILGRGGMGTVYRVQDLAKDRVLALKVLAVSELSPEALGHFEEEFLAMTKLLHPNLVRVFDFGTLDEAEDPSHRIPFFTMELVQGTPIDRVFRDRLDLPAFLQCIAGATQALAYLHSRGLVHYDVKPSNLLVGGDPEAPRVKLMDLGLMDTMRTSKGVSIRGTVGYIAPEIALGQTVDARADIYSLGVVMYETLAGLPPFRGPSPISILRGHIEEMPPPMGGFDRQVPQELEEIVMRCLAKDPADRYSGADALLAALSGVAGKDLGRESLEGGRSYVAGGGFLGRARDMDTLKDVLARTESSGGALVAVHGESGIGKSRLLREFRVHAQLRGAAFHLGRCSGEPRVPYGPFLAILESVVRRHHALTTEILAGAAPAIVTLVPRLAALPEFAGAAEVAPLEPDEERLRLLESLTELLTSVSRRIPLVLAIEDLEQADEATHELLLALCRRLSPPAAAPAEPARLLIVTSFSDEDPPPPALHDLLAYARKAGVLRDLPLRPLSPQDTGRLLSSMVGARPVPPAVSRRIYAESRGNPSLIEGLMTLLVDEGVVRPASTEPFGTIDFDALEVPHRMKGVIQRRIDRLDGPSRGLLETIAVLGTSGITKEAIAAAAGAPWETLAPHIDPLVREDLLEIQTDGPGEARYRFTRPSIGRVVYDSASAARREGTHRRYAEHLEAAGSGQDPDDLATLAHHFFHGEQHARAFKYIVREADRARAIHAMSDAVARYSRALDLALSGRAQASGPTIASLLDRRGGCLEVLGRLDEAEDNYRALLQRAESDRDEPHRARAWLNIGNVRTRRAEYAAALEAYERALEGYERLEREPDAAEVLRRIAHVEARTGDYPAARKRLARAESAARGLSDQALRRRCLTDRWYVHLQQGENAEALECLREAREIVDRSEDRRGLALVLHGQGRSLEFQGRFPNAIQCYEEALGIAREIGDVPLVATCATGLGGAYARLGEYGRAITFFDESLEIGRRIGAREAVLPNLRHMATWHLMQRRYKAAFDLAEEALALARKAGSLDEAAIALSRLGDIQQRVGDFQAAGDRLEEALDIIREMKNDRWLPAVLTDLGEYRLWRGELESARAHLQEACFVARRTGDRRREAMGLLRLAESHLEGGDFARALAATDKALAIAEGSPLKKEIADGRLLRSEVEALRPGGDPVAAEEGARRAFDIYEELRDPEQAAQAAWTIGRLRRREGDRAGAEEWLGKSRSLLEGVRASLPEEWRDLYFEHPKRRPLLADFRAAELIASAAEPAPLVVEEDAARLRAEVQTLGQLIEINKKLTSTLRLSDLLELILDRAIELTRAGRGFLLVTRGEDFVFEAARGADGTHLTAEERALSRSIARQAMAGGSPILATDAQSDSRFRSAASVRDLRIRSVVVVPLRVRDDLIGALYLDSLGPKGLFNKEHVHWLSLFADQAVIAIENARLVSELDARRAQIERLNGELSRKVEEQETEIADVRVELHEKQSFLESRFSFGNIIGGSPPMQGLYRVLDRIVETRIPILITGESGTGKELVARAIHYNGPRRGESFFSVNCAAFTDTLLASELFGHRKGAFTGADRDRHGIFELADGGTLFLDEVADMSGAMQAQVLRALQDGEILPVGGRENVRVDVRVVSATNRDLRSLIAAGSFREDLYYRLNVASVVLPPLRERREDIALLVDHFLHKIGQDEGRPAKGIEGEALRLLEAFDWPGNIRELEHEILKLVTFSRAQTITERDVRRISSAGAETLAGGPAGAFVPATLEEHERLLIARALRASRWNRSEAARTLGIDRATLFRKLRRFKIAPPSGH